ncbi:hypothetical protein OOJ91_33535 [Micromonospora lupini]|uniref:Mom family adenine methylcarbamoylation protein n=1 Tax=Micromonospora lupini TaxID=285679 RepID=UPI002251A05B|nr:hypothetical protein [Micromonospora lupini]MCX5070769.1 hypothetical protein [Micromonospora lupini]
MPTPLALTTTPASLDGWCQRWNRRQHSWRHVSEGGFDKRRYAVEPIEESLAKEFVAQHHYSGTFVAAIRRYGLLDLAEGRRLVGVIVLSSPMQERVLTLPFPHLEPYAQSAELGRLVLLDEVPANAESYAMRRAFKLAAGDGFRGVVAYSDPTPRTRRNDAGELEEYMPGHWGDAYQGCGGDYYGLSRRVKEAVLPDSTRMTDRTLRKVIGAESGFRGVVTRLVDFGAMPPTMADLVSKESRKAWLAAALATAAERWEISGGKHRYAFKIGGRRQKRKTVLDVKTKPYPKRDLALAA